jgi:hypothetical protein
MPEANGWFLVVTVRRFLVLVRSSFFLDCRSQTLECRWDVFGKNSAGDRAAVPHHFDQSDRHITEHSDVGVNRAGKSD